MSPQRLTRDDWTAAALRAMGQVGVAGIAIEALAKDLGATKGSFYWHFSSRADLVTASLEHWERASTETIFEALDPVPSGTERLRHLVQALFLPGEPRAASQRAVDLSPKGIAIDTSIALTADATQHPEVAEVVARVSARRMAFVADELVMAGVPAAEARHRALLAYTAYLGFSMLARSAPAAMPARGKASAEFVDEMLRLLTEGTGGAD